MRINMQRADKNYKDLKQKQKSVIADKTYSMYSDFSLLQVTLPEVHHMVSPGKKWGWTLGRNWSSIMKKSQKDKLQIRNSTVDFLVFTKDAHEDGIEARVQNHDVWLTHKAIGQLFEVERSVVTKHLKNVFESGELSEDSVCAIFAQTADEGNTYQYKFYSLPAIVAVGYRINSGR